jgi:hypothetical protein
MKNRERVAPLIGMSLLSDKNATLEILKSRVGDQWFEYSADPKNVGEHMFTIAQALAELEKPEDERTFESGEIMIHGKGGDEKIMLDRLTGEIKRIEGMQS